MIEWFRASTLLLFVLWAWLMLSALADTPRVAFINPPSVVPEDSAITYYLRVPRHEDNRKLIVAAFDGQERVSSMERDLHGLHSQALWNVTWRLPAGELQLVAAVFDGQKQVGRDTKNLIVYSRSPMEVP